MDWFGRQGSETKADTVGPQALLQDLGKRIPCYLDDADQGRLVYPACKRKPGDTDGDVRAIWDHTRLEAMRYLIAVPARGFELLAEPARQPELLDTYLRQRPHDDTVIDFTGTALNDIAIAIVAGLNWLTHCATLVEVNRERFSGTLRTFRKIAVVGQKWWAMEGAEARYSEMLEAKQTPPLMLHLVWLEYTRLAKEIAFAASFGPSADRAIEKRREMLGQEFAGRPAEISAALTTFADRMANFEKASDPDQLAS